MNAKFTDTRKGTWAYIQKSVRIDGRSTTLTIKRLGLLEDIRKEYGCEDPRQWVIDLARKMTEDERNENKTVSLDFYPGKSVTDKETPLRMAGDLMLLPLYTGLGLPKICSDIAGESRAKYDLNEILQTLVISRILYPCSKLKTLNFSEQMVSPPKIKQEEIYRALSQLSEHMVKIQSGVYKNSCGITPRCQRVIYYDCTNYFFETDDNDKDYIDKDTGEIVIGLRKRGKSKENRPNPIVQMGMFMDMDGIPLAFTLFPGNESEQASLQPLEETLNRHFDMTEYVVSTDAGLASESNRRYNMAEGRDYICVQSIPSLKGADQDMAVSAEGWRIAYCDSMERSRNLNDSLSDNGIFNLDTLRKALGKDPYLLKGTTLYKEILVGKEHKTENPAWLEAKRKSPDAKPVDSQGKAIPHYLTSARQERTIVTYSHDYALYLRHKRQQRMAIANKIVKNKQTKSRISQQSPLNYVETVHKTDDGQTAVKIEMHINRDVIEQEERFDGFYAYGTSLDDHALMVLRARSFHHEIEHLFRTTKTFLEARPVYLQRQDRIKSHFLICFLAMVILKILQKQLREANPETYASEPLTIDALIETLQNIRLGKLPGNNYMPMFKRSLLTDQLQELVGVDISKQLINSSKINAYYRKVKKG